MAVSNMQIMRTLGAKDLQLFRMPIIALLAAGAGCHVVAIAVSVLRGLEYHGDAEFVAKALFLAASVANAVTSLSPLY